MITTLDKGTALVIIDLQKGILSYPLARPVKDILENNTKLIDAFRKAGLPIVFVNVNHAGSAWSKTRKDFAPARPAVVAADSYDIVPEIKTQPDDIFITKHTWGAFFETNLHEELQKRNITGIVLSGVATSIGVEGTARHASERGYNIAFVEDAMTDLSAEGHEHSIKRIFPKIGEIGNTEIIIEALSKF